MKKICNVGVWLAITGLFGLILGAVGCGDADYSRGDGDAPDGAGGSEVKEVHSAITTASGTWYQMEGDYTESLQVCPAVEDNYCNFPIRAYGYNCDTLIGDRRYTTVSPCWNAAPSLVHIGHTTTGHWYTGNLQDYPVLDRSNAQDMAGAYTMHYTSTTFSGTEMSGPRAPGTGPSLWSNPVAGYYQLGIPYPDTCGPRCLSSYGCWYDEFGDYWCKMVNVAWNFSTAGVYAGANVAPSIVATGSPYMTLPNSVWSIFDAYGSTGADGRNVYLAELGMVPMSGLTFIYHGWLTRTNALAPAVHGVPQ